MILEPDKASFMTAAPKKLLTWERIDFTLLFNISPYVKPHAIFFERSEYCRRLAFCYRSCGLQCLSNLHSYDALN
jgi:hypothetical protein